MDKQVSVRRRTRQFIWSVFSLFLLWLACEKLPELTADFIPAADFEDQESVMLSWNNKHSRTLLPLLAGITKNDTVTLFYNEKNNRRRHIEVALMGAGVRMEHITLVPFRLEKDNIWIRDYGPSFLQNETGQTAVVGFNYKHLSMEEYTDFSDQFSSRMKIPFYKTRLYSAGGGREINGKGTIILVESYEKEINPGMSKLEIEAEYRKLYNQKKIIWLKRGIPQDDFFGHGPVMDNIYPFGVHGHIDEFCRFSGPNTLLLAEVDSSDLERHPFYELIHHRLEENYRILSEATDQDGQPFTIIRVPQAAVIFTAAKLKGKDIFYTPVTSYLNFVITNKSVIIPAYYQQGDPDYVREKDEKAIEVFSKAFPTREVQTINALELNKDGGGLHCVTLPKPHKIPKKKLKS